LHVSADILFAIGLLANSLLVAALSFQGADSLAREQRLIAGVRRWDRVVTAPTLGLAWICGAWLAWKAGWFGASWLSAKLVFVVLVSALHGTLAAALKRLCVASPAPPARAWRVVPPVVVVAFVAIAWLALFKPF
ncbi:MAG: CopD family protein, partial [Betaproteobacteria bacterium]